ncbi:MAG: hypothetical protein GX580_08930 [Candidatus Hydrogenedens sp.]|nr:hypothetical protein [Candidatus Hydrogenedentota bacterium]NLF57749.1 hypothetical protein [Candidatus Hydrogenedens sp.]
MLAFLGAVAAQLPWWLLLAGALRKVLLHSGRLQRLQAEGAAVAAGGMLACWVMFDPTVGVDPARESSLAYWLARGEEGLFLIGMMLVGMGYFLERRPRPGLTPWPRAGKAAAAAAILAGGLIALPLSGVDALAGQRLPWALSRLSWSLGMLPFAAAYLAEAWRRAPLELKHAVKNEMDI